MNSSKHDYDIGDIRGDGDVTNHACHPYISHTFSTIRWVIGDLYVNHRGVVGETLKSETHLMSPTTHRNITPNSDACIGV